ncbi:type I-C CRISPR-associated protein Cas8c/Csd1 [candidate division KSB1 bacterium]|nr:type I-C CRISPR-associated protein Cas8c/Csd1 [candidate division KSB1 bacterium]
MAWMQKLYKTYASCSEKQMAGNSLVLPVSHTTQQAHVEVVLDLDGNFRRASVISPENATTLIPCTEKSGGRSGNKPINHPLCDKLQYVAGDFVDFGGEVTSGFANDPAEPHRDYVQSLSKWASSKFCHLKLNAILRYVKKGRVIADLVCGEILPIHCDGETRGKLLKRWEGKKDQMPLIFKLLPGSQCPQDAFVRWRVEIPGDLVSGTWEDSSLIQAWIGYYESRQSKRGFCTVSGVHSILAEQHPAKLRNGADKAKLISSNDKTGYTFRGRFIDSDQATGVGFDVTQKAHNALRWLIDRQGYRNGDQVFVAWAVGGKPLADPFADSLSLFLAIEGEDAASPENSITVEPGDVGQAFALRLNKAIAGYSARINPTDDIVVIGLDSATPGRMAIILYRELIGSEFLKRIQCWHERYAWLQNFGRDRHFVGVPSPRDIAEGAFGRRLDDRLRKATVERLLPCIVDGSAVPRDLIISCCRRASNRTGMEKWEWEKCLGIACAMFKGYHKERGYKMTLENERTTRDYLYGRLLAIADNIEGYALRLAEESAGRNTTAARLMQRFADRPYSTWRNIELALVPYKSRLKSSEKGRRFLHKREQALDEVMCAFKPDDFIKDAALSGEFLLGYHCERTALFQSSVNEEVNIDKEK